MPRAKVPTQRLRSQTGTARELGTPGLLFLGAISASFPGTAQKYRADNGTGVWRDAGLHLVFAKGAHLHRVDGS